MVTEGTPSKVPRPSDDLNTKQLEALRQMHKMVETAPDMELKKWASHSGESVDDLLCRFLKARKWDVKKAFHLLEEDVKWRREMKVDELIHMTPTEILSLDEETIRKYLPSWVQGTDRMGRPILYKSYGGNFEIWQLTSRGTTVEKLLRYHVYENEQALRMLAEQPEEKRASTLTFVVEAKGWHLGLATRDALRYIKGMADMDTTHYPERLGLNFVMNTPLIFTATWRLIRSWLDPVTVKKILIFGTNEAQWKAALLEHIAPEQLAVEYGGLSTKRQHNTCTSSSPSTTSPATSSSVTTTTATSSATTIVQTSSMTKELEPQPVTTETRILVL